MQPAVDVPRGLLAVAPRLNKGGAQRVNGVAATDGRAKIALKGLNRDRAGKLPPGKKRRVLLRPASWGRGIPLQEISSAICR